MILHLQDRLWQFGLVISFEIGMATDHAAAVVAIVVRK